MYCNRCWVKPIFETFEKTPNLKLKNVDSINSDLLVRFFHTGTYLIFKL
jgi:hypothetical protein